MKASGQQMMRFGLFAWTAAGLACVARGANICVEAEASTTNEAPMALIRADAPSTGSKPMSGASGNAYLEVPLGAGKTPKVKAGSAKLTVNIPDTGAYIFWLRTCWEGECSNTVLVQIDDRPPFLVGADATYHTWHWVKFPVSKMTSPPVMTQGVHTVTILHREDGVRVDQLLLTTSTRFVPVGVEKTGVTP